jgi:hypothetical protein
MDSFQKMMVFAIVACAVNVSAFVPQSSNSIQKETTLNAVPPMIIGPFIKKMRDEQAKKKMPMVEVKDSRGQAAGIRVGGTSWKWPPIWPYADDFFTPTEDIATLDPSTSLQNMAGMMSGTPQTPTPDEIEVKEVEKLDVFQYWAEERGDVRTELDEEAVEKLRR